MAVKSTVSFKIAYTGDLSGQQAFAAAENTAGSGADEIKTLASGFNTITVPTGGTTPKGVLIIPPAGNTATITAKGVTGDTGFLLHATDPTYLALSSAQATFGLTTSAQIVGVRFVWN